MKRKINAVAFELVLPKNLKMHPVFHVSLLKPTMPNPFPNRVSEVPSSVLIEGNEEFGVEWRVAMYWLLWTGCYGRVAMDGLLWTVAMNWLLWTVAMHWLL